MNKQMILSLDDFRFVRLSCVHCPTIVTLDMKETTEVQRKQPFIPALCPGCKKPYDSAYPEVEVFQRVYRELVPIADRISFHGEPRSE